MRLLTPTSRPPMAALTVSWCAAKKRQCGTPDPGRHTNFSLTLPPNSYQARRPAPRRASRLVVRAGTISSNDFKVGTTIELDNAPWRIVGKCFTRVGEKRAVCAFACERA